MHRFSQKAIQELFYPSQDMNKAEREQTLKHDPLAEYRGAFYRNRAQDQRPTKFHLPNGMLHKAIAAAALDIPGATKAEIGRLTRITNLNIDLYGTPQLYSTMVRNSGIGRTPDVRTRPVFPEWACRINVEWVATAIGEKALGNLVYAAGRIIGIGDWRGERGGPFGAFKLVHPNATNAEGREAYVKYQRIIATQGLKAQEHAFRHPDFYDQDTADLITWFESEIRRREKAGLLSADFDLEPLGGLRTIVERRLPGQHHDEAGEYIGAEG
jgi:hypothetical protein